MTNRLEDELQRIIAHMNQEEDLGQEHDQPGTTEQEGAPGTRETRTEMSPDDIQDVYVLIIRERGVEAAEEEEPSQVVESTLVPPQQPSLLSLLPAYVICCGYLLLLESTLALQLFCLFNPPLAIVTIIPRSQQVTMTGTLQLGRLLHPITISQAQTTATTGTGHQDARAARGFLTFYNGQFQPVTIAVGTVLTGKSGIQVVTDQDAQIPAAHPPIFGQVSVPAHATSPGRAGNIAAYDIDHACCATSVLAQNVQPFTGGQDEREFQTVTKQDIAKVVTPLTTAVPQSLAGAFQEQRKFEEHLYLLPCTPTVTADHQVGEEATQVKVTVSETCSAVAYDSQQIATQATLLLTAQAQHHLGTGYSLLGPVQVSIQQATVTGRSTVFLSFSASGTWVYGLSQSAQERIKHLLVGKTTQQAMHLLATLPGVEQATIRFTGFGDETRLPKQSTAIHLVFVVM